MRTVKKSVDPVSRELKELKKRLEVLEDERQIREALHAYTHTIDYGPSDGWAGVFTEDGVFDVCRANGVKTRRKEGHAELTAHVAAKRMPPVLHDKHLVCSPIITITGKTAKVESYVVTLREMEEDGPRVRSWGRYRDTLVKQRNGKWLFKERLAEMETGIGRHWRKEWDAASKAA